MKRFKLHNLLILLFLFASIANAQVPINDNCENASEIGINNNGYAYGQYISYKADVTKATLQPAELCIKDLEDVGNCTKTVWYKFYIPTTRNISITLTQKDSAIPQIFAGFNIYKIKDCNYSLSDIENNLPPINKFGTSGNTCLSQGWYYIQVGCKKKAKGELWVELKSDKPNSQAYDSLMGYFDFGLVKDNVKKASFNIYCASVEQDEAAAINDINYTKSVWFAVTFDKNAVSNKITISSSNGRSDFLKYRIFKGNINYDSIKSTKPFYNLTSSNEALLENCTQYTNNVKYYVQLISQDNWSYLEVGVSNASYQLDNWNTPNTDNIVTLSAAKNIATSKHYFNCDGLLKKHTCKNVIPPVFIKPRKLYSPIVQTVYDTFHYASYTVLNVLTAGNIGIRTFENNNDNKPLLYIVYKGNIKNGCSLLKIIDTIHYFHYGSSYFDRCYDVGEYTILTCVKDLNIQQVTQDFYLTPKFNNIKYNTHQAPEKLKSFNPYTDKNFESEKITFEDKNISITIDSVILEGRMSFHEITITQTGDFNIYSNRYDLYIFKGNLSQGNAQRISTIDYRYPRRAYGFYLGSWGWQGSCFSLPQGDYTLITINPKNKDYPFTPCLNTEHWINFTTNGICPVTNNIEPQFALPVYRNLDVLKADSNKNGLNYTFNLPTCKDCRTVSKTKPFISCKNKNFYINNTTNFNYYTFFVSENVSLSMPSNVELFRGNCMLDPNLVLDSNNIVSPCQKGNLICNLEGNRFYTIVMVGSSELKSSFSIIFTKHKVSENDFAYNAYNFGHISLDTAMQSTFQPITCHTNVLKTDPSIYANNYGTSFIIPYKDTLNFKRYSYNGYQNDLSFKNLWYTFTAEANMDIGLTIKNKRQYTNSIYYEVFTYKGNYNKDFDIVKNNNFDTTNTGMIKYSGDRGSGSIGNISCNELRYFVLIYGDRYYSYADEYALTIKAKKTNTIPKGDNCKDAITGNYNTLGNYQLKAYNTCHTYGGSPFEDEKLERVKSTWFKLSVNNLTNFDLSLQSNGSIIKYNVYGGSCKAMTKILTVNSSYSYFTLSCMNSGDYFIQVLCNDYYSQEIGLAIKIQNPQFNNCKPYEFKFPIALFKYNGGCNLQDTIQFKNLSTQGEDMAYKWYINNQYFSDAFTPYFTRKNPILKDTNTIKLIAINTNEITSDTFEVVYILDTKNYRFKIIGPLKSYCSDTVVLKVDTDFPAKINYEWYYHYSPNYPLSDKPTYTLYGVSAYKYFAKGMSDNCMFSDTFTPNVIRTLNKYRDTILCAGLPYTIKNKSENYMYYYSNDKYINIPKNDSINIIPPDTFQLYYYEGRCNYIDTISIYSFVSESKIIDTLYCFENPHSVTYLDAGNALQYHWGAANNYNRILPINTYGTYKVNRIDNNNCKDSIAFNVITNCDFTVYIPNAFSPNIDVLNEEFYPVISGRYTHYEMQIYNRWGELVFETTNSQKWNAMYKNKLALSGVYRYQIKVYDSANKPFLFKGTFTLLN